MIRVVVQHLPNLYAILGLAELEQVPQQLQLGQQTYYRVETHDHWVLFKRAVSGYGALNAGGGVETMDPQQR